MKGDTAVLSATMLATSPPIQLNLVLVSVLLKLLLKDIMQRYHIVNISLIQSLRKLCSIVYAYYETEAGMEPENEVE